jgi:hypothetical protein
MIHILRQSKNGQTTSIEREEKAAVTTLWLFLPFIVHILSDKPSKAVEVWYLHDRTPNPLLRTSNQEVLRIRGRGYINFQGKGRRLQQNDNSQELEPLNTSYCPPSSIG